MEELKYKHFNQLNGIASPANWHLSEATKYIKHFTLNSIVHIHMCCWPLGKITEFNLDFLSHTRSPLCDLMCCANGQMKIEINEIIKIRSLQLFFTQNDDDVTKMNLTIWNVH